MEGRHSDYGPPRGPGGNITPRPKLIQITLTPQEVIPTSENVWKPSVKSHKVLDENEKVLVDVRALLNKLTSSNYVKLMQRMVEGQIPFHETPERLQATVGLIFDKALEEPNYAEFYAKMCRDLIKTEAKDAKGDVVKFRTVLLQQTQRYFEKTQKEEEEAELEKNEEDPEALQEKRAKAKRHYLGNIRFISELYKVEMLTDRVILSCFQKLLPKKSNSEDADEEKLECLCKLLQTCAKMIKEQNTVDIIFGQLKKMIDANVSSSRIRFMMEDTIDLKNNNYVPRKIVSAKPTTIQEVHAAKQKEEQEIRQSVADHGPVQLPRHVQMPPRGGMPGGRGGMMPQGGGRGLSKPNSVPSGLSKMGGGVPPRHGGRPVLPQMETGKKKLMELLNSHDGGGAPALGPQRAQWDAGSDAGMHKNPAQARPPENKSASSSRESSMNRLNNPPGSLTHTPTIPDEERSGRPLASGTATSSQVSGTPSFVPVHDDVDKKTDAAEEQTGAVIRVLGSEEEDSRSILLEVRSLLSKLTPNNYDTLRRKMLEDTMPCSEPSDGLHSAAGLFFQKNKRTVQRELELSCGDIHDLAKTQRWGDVTVELLKKERFFTNEDIMSLCKADFQEPPLNAIPLRDRKSILAWIEGNASTKPSAFEIPNTWALGERNSTIAGDQKAAQLPKVSTADPSALAKNSINDQKHILSEKLLLFVKQLYPNFIGKVTSRVTGMLLDLDNAELLRLLDSPDELKNMVDQAVAILRNYWPAGDAPA